MQTYTAKLLAAVNAELEGAAYRLETAVAQIVTRAAKRETEPTNWTLGIGIASTIESYSETASEVVGFAHKLNHFRRIAESISQRDLPQAEIDALVKTALAELAEEVLEDVIDGGTNPQKEHSAIYRQRGLGQLHHWLTRRLPKQLAE